MTTFHPNRGGRWATAVVGLLALVAPSCPAPAVQSGASAPQQPCDQGGVAAVVDDVAPSVVTVRQPNGIGSGVLYKPSVVITNHHVVADNTEVIVTYADGSASRAAVVASDAVTDVAVLRTERTGLTPARFAQDLPRQGCQVI